MRDLYHNLKVAEALAPAVHAASADGDTVDVTEASGVIFALVTGAIAGAGDFTAKLQESADGTTWGDVADKWVQGDLPATLEASASYRLGYIGKMPYARLSLVKTGGTSIAAAASAILRPLTRPVA